MDPNKCRTEGTKSVEYSGWGETSNLNLQWIKRNLLCLFVHYDRLLESPASISSFVLRSDRYQSSDFKFEFKGNSCFWTQRLPKIMNVQHEKHDRWCFQQVVTSTAHSWQLSNQHNIVTARSQWFVTAATNMSNDRCHLHTPGSIEHIIAQINGSFNLFVLLCINVCMFRDLLICVYCGLLVGSFN